MRLGQGKGSLQRRPPRLRDFDRTISIALSPRSSRSRRDVASPARIRRLSNEIGKPRAIRMARLQPSGLSASRAMSCLPILAVRKSRDKTGPSSFPPPTPRCRHESSNSGHLHFHRSYSAVLERRDVIHLPWRGGPKLRRRRRSFKTWVVGRGVGKSDKADTEATSEG